MRKISYILLPLCLYFFSIQSSAQLFVKDNSYVYNKGSVVYVKSYVNLQGDTDANGTSGNFYLRKEGQLLQGATSTSTNTGAGKLSVFQEGTVDNYEYNYWCSPVGNASTTVGNEKFDIGMLYRPSDNVNSTQAITTGSYNGISNPLTIAKYWIWTFRTGSNYSNWYHISDMSYTDSNALKAGEGFTMKGTAGFDYVTAGESTFNNTYDGTALPAPIASAQRYDFRGKPNDGNITIAVLPPSGTTINSTLTGNPYPSAINLNYFLLENSGRAVNYTTGAISAEVISNKVIDGSAYFWEQNKTVNSHNTTSYDGGYAAYVPNGTSANSPGTYNTSSFSTYNSDGSVNSGSGNVGGSYKRMFSPVGQGFMVSGFTNGSPTNNAVMKNVYRAFVKEGIANNSEFERNSNNSTASVNELNWDEIPNVAGVDYTQFSKLEVPQIKVHTVMNNVVTKEITMAFNPYSTDGYDSAMEAQSIDNFSTDIYFSIPDNEKPFVITTLPFSIEKRIPVTLKSSGAGTFKVKVDSFINFDTSNNVYLYDSLTDEYHDIKTVDYELQLSPGTYSNRFEITFLNSQLGTTTNNSQSFIIVQNNSNQMLSISNPNMLDIKSVALYDMGGKLIFDKVDVGANSTYEFSTSNLSDAVYVVKLETTDNKSVGQKIIVRKSN